MSRKISLLPWLIISSLTQIILSISVVGYISYRSGQEMLYRFARELMLQAGDRSISKIDQYLTSADLINRLNEEAITLGILDPQDLEAIHRQLILQQRQFHNVTSILYGDPSGNVRLVNKITPNSATKSDLQIALNDPVSPGKLHFYQLNQLGMRGEYLHTLDFNVHDRSWYQQAVTTKQPGWTKPFPTVRNGLLTINAYRPVFSRDNQELIGVFSVNISIEQICSFLRQIPVSPSSQIYLLDHNYLIASSDHSLPHGLDIPTPENDQVIDPRETDNYYTFKQINRFLQSKFPNLDNIQSAETFDLTIKQEKYLVRIIPYGSELGLDWLMVLVIPESDFTEQNRANLRKTILLCFVSGSLALLNSLVTSRWIVIPILRLQKFALNLPQSNNQVTCLDSPIQEINQLGLILEQTSQEIQTTIDKLKDSEHKLHQILEHLPLGVVVLDANGTITYINPKGMKLLDIQTIPEAPPGKHSQVYQLFRRGTDDLYPYSELPSIKALQGKNIYIDDLEIRVKGKSIYCEVYSNPVYNHKQEIIGCVNLFQDISDRLSTQAILTDYNRTLQKQINEATQALHKNQTLLYKVLEKVPGNISAWISYPDGRIDYQYINPLLSQIMEIDPETLTYYPNFIFELIHPDDRSNYQQQIAHSSATLQLFDHEWRIISISGKIKWLQGILQPELGENGTIYWYGVILDITERKKAEAELRESEEKFRTCFNNVGTAMGMVNLEGYFLQVNKVFCEMIGYSTEELLQMSFQQITYPADLSHCLELMVKMSAGEIDNFQMEKRYLNKNNQIIYALTNVSLVRNQDNLPLYAIAQIQDISARHYDELELEKAKLAAEAANLAKTEFIAAMSHELRTPLNAILGFAQLLLKTVTNSTATAQLQAILDNGNHLLDLINNLLTIAQIETGNFNLQLNRVNLSQLLEKLHNSYALQAKAKGLELIWCYDTDLPCYLESDEVKLRQIFINLLNNALKFTEQGTITFNASQDHNLLIFTITDTGEGIAPEEITKLFQPFSQTATGKNSQQGTGLGLAVTKQLLNYLEGEIIVNSQPGIGTKFTIEIPLRNPSTKMVTKNCLVIENKLNLKQEQSLEELPTIWLRKFQQSILEGDIDLMVELVEQVRKQNETLADYLINLVKSFRLRELLDLTSQYDQQN